MLVIKRLRASETGTSAIEFAVIGGILCTLVLGVLDFGRMFWQQMEVGNAARAGAEYAVKNGWNSSGIQTAVTSATNLSTIHANPTPTETCGCPDAVSGITTKNCGAACSSGGVAGTYVTVSAQASYTPLITWPGLSNPVTLSSSTIVRIN